MAAALVIEKDKQMAQTGQNWTQSGFNSGSVRVARPISVLYGEKDDEGQAIDPTQISEDTVYQYLIDEGFIYTGRNGQTPFIQVEYDGDPEGLGYKFAFNPWLIQDSVRIQRDLQNRFRFNALFEYSTPGNLDLSVPSSPNTTNQEFGDVMIPVPQAVSEYPWLRRRIWGSEDRIIFEESKTGGQVDMRLPTGSLFSEPFRRRTPTRTYIQLQYETGITDIEQIIDERLFTTNNIAFGGDPAPDPTEAADGGWAQPPRWMITDIQFQAINAPVQAEIGTISYVDAYLMLYTIERNEADGGWLDRRALIDKFILVNGVKTPYRDPVDGTTVVDALLNDDGTEKDPQTGTPTYRDYVVQPEGIWSFLRQ